MFDVDLVQAEVAGFVSEVVKEAGQGTGQDGDHDHGTMPLVKVGEKRVILGCGG